MATYTAAAGGGNWSNNATWGGAGHPVAGDTAIIASGSGAVTVDVNSACTTLTIQAAKTLTMTANLTVSGVVTFTGTDVLSSTGILYIGGGITIGAKGSVGSTSTATINFNATQTVTSANFTFGCHVVFSSGTITLGAVTHSFLKSVIYTGGTMSVNTAHVANMVDGSRLGTSGMTWANVTTPTGTITLTQNLNATTLLWGHSTIWAGAYDITLVNLKYGGVSGVSMTGNSVTTFVAGRTVTVTGAFWMTGNGLFTTELKSSSAGTEFALNYSGTVTDCKIYGAVFTDVDASDGNPIRGLFITRSNSTGIYQYRNNDIVGAGASLCHLN